MKWFMDTEFHEDGVTIDLISIAFVAEDGRFYYAVSTEFDAVYCSRWVKDHVLPHLPPNDSHFWKSRAAIAAELRGVLLDPSGEPPEIWSYFADYDWVVFCQLYGTMIDLPAGYPQYCRDIKQLMDQYGIARSTLPDPTGTEHDALEDARHHREMYLALQKRISELVYRTSRRGRQ